MSPSRRRTLARPLAYLLLPCLHLARLAFGFLHPRGADLQDLKLDLGYAPARARDARRDVARLAVELSR